MSIIKAVTEFVRECPFLDQFVPLFVDHTEDDPTNYGISSTGENVLYSYMDGSEVRQHNFVMYAREFARPDSQRVINTEFIENFSNWLYRMGVENKLPYLGEDMDPISMSSSNGMLFDIDDNGERALYQIQFELTYQKGGM